MVRSTPTDGSVTVASVPTTGGDASRVRLQAQPKPTQKGPVRPAAEPRPLKSLRPQGNPGVAAKKP